MLKQLFKRFFEKKEKEKEKEKSLEERLWDSPFRELNILHIMKRIVQLHYLSDEIVVAWQNNAQGKSYLMHKIHERWANKAYQRCIKECPDYIDEFEMELDLEERYGDE